MEMENVIPTENKARETLFSLFSGKRMLFIVILFAISLIMQIISAATSESGLGAIAELLDSFMEDGSGELSSLVNTIDNIIKIVNFILLIPLALYTLSVLFFYIGGKKYDKTKVSLGAKFFKIYNIIYMVYYGLCMAGIAIIGVVLCIIFAEIGESVVLPIILCLVFIGIVYLIASLYTKSFIMARGISDVMQTGKNQLYVFKYVIFMNWLMGIGAILGGIGNGIVALISGVLIGLTYIFIATIFSSYKKEMGLPSKEEMSNAPSLQKLANKYKK